MTKKIEAIFREEKLIAVKEALAEIGIVGAVRESIGQSLALGTDCRLPCALLVLDAKP